MQKDELEKIVSSFFLKILYNRNRYIWYDIFFKRTYEKWRVGHGGPWEEG